MANTDIVRLCPSRIFDVANMSFNAIRENKILAKISESTVLHNKTRAKDRTSTMGATINYIYNESTTEPPPQNGPQPPEGLRKGLRCILLVPNIRPSSCFVGIQKWWLSYVCNSSSQKNDNTLYNASSQRNDQIKLTHFDETKKGNYDSQVVRAKENL